MFPQKKINNDATTLRNLPLLTLMLRAQSEEVARYLDSVWGNQPRPFGLPVISQRALEKEPTIPLKIRKSLEQEKEKNSKVTNNWK